jgi:hypothetical protein
MGQRLGRAAAGDGATLACRIDGLDQEPVTSGDPDPGGALIGSEHAKQLDDLAVEIELHQPLALPIETSHCLGIIHDAALEGQSGIGFKSARERPERPHQEPFEHHSSQKSHTEQDQSGDPVLEQQARRAEADQDAEPDARREKERPPGTRVSLVMMSAVPVIRVTAGQLPASRMPQMLVAAVVTRPMPVLETEEGHCSQPGGAEGEGERVEGHGSRIYRGKETYPVGREGVRIYGARAVESAGTVALSWENWPPIRAPAVPPMTAPRAAPPSPEPTQLP